MSKVGFRGNKKSLHSIMDENCYFNTYLLAYIFRAIISMLTKIKTLHQIWQSASASDGMRAKSPPKKLPSLVSNV